MPKIVVSNKKAFFNYEMIEKFEAGISLKGSEVKSIVLSEVSLDEAFVIIKNNEAFILNMYVAHFKQSNFNNHETTATRRLLLNKHEILRMSQYLKKHAATIVPLDIHLTRGKIKLTIALARHKNAKDKRETIKQREEKRAIKQYA